MMMNRKYLSIFLVACISGVISAQDDDHGIWLGVTVKHGLTKKIDLEFSGSVKTFSNVSQVDQTFLEGTIDYTFNKYLSVAGAYRFVNSLEDDDQYHFRHRVALDLKGKLPAGRFTLSTRARFQRTELNYIEELGDPVAKYYGRIKFKSSYDFSSFPLTPYLYYEPFLPMFTGEEFKLARNRFAAGVVLKISRKSSFETEFIFQRDYNKKNISDIQILSLNYTLKF